MRGSGSGGAGGSLRKRERKIETETEIKDMQASAGSTATIQSNRRGDGRNFTQAQRADTKTQTHAVGGANSAVKRWHSRKDNNVNGSEEPGWGEREYEKKNQGSVRHNKNRCKSKCKCKSKSKSKCKNKWEEGGTGRVRKNTGVRRNSHEQRCERKLVYICETKKTDDNADANTNANGGCECERGIGMTGMAKP